MRVLQVNKYHYLKSGTERYLFNLTHLLESQGHTVAHFSMFHPRNRPSAFVRHFVPGIEYRGLNPLGMVQAAARALWYPTAARQIQRLIEEFRPDIVHLHNIYHQISPAILPAIRKHGIPIVHTLHDYKLVCPNYLLRTGGEVCHRCERGQYFQAVRYRCLHGSLAWSLVAALEMMLHARFRIYQRHISRFIAPSRFLLERAVASGIAGRQLVHIPYFLYADEWSKTAAGEGTYIMFLGRLAEEKGLFTLLAAMQKAPMPLLIVGEGPMKSAVATVIKNRNLAHVRMAGHLTGTALAEAMKGARFVVAPSEWYEVFGQIIIESFAMARPVVATSLGGIPEVVEEGVDGLLVPPGDPRALANALQWLWHRPETCTAMGQAAWEKVRQRYDAPAHYQRIRSLYREVRN